LLHNRAYELLGLTDWEYGKVQVSAQSLPEFIDRLDETWAGFSVTMPLKQEMFKYATFIDDTAVATNAINTAVCKNGELHCYNTDVYGIEQAFLTAGTTSPRKIGLILGSGATARSAAYALKSLGCSQIYVASRSTAPWIEAAGLTHLDLAELPTAAFVPDAVVSTLPWTPAGELLPQLAQEVPWFSAVPLLECAFPKVLPNSIAGEVMLTHQAIGQIKLMTGLDVAFDELICAIM
jgi:shikimate dehydrogenase